MSIAHIPALRDVAPHRVPRPRLDRCSGRVYAALNDESTVTDLRVIVGGACARYSPDKAHLRWLDKYLGGNDLSDFFDPLISGKVALLSRSGSRVSRLHYWIACFFIFVVDAGRR